MAFDGVTFLEASAGAGLAFLAVSSAFLAALTGALAPSVFYGVTAGLDMD